MSDANNSKPRSKLTQSLLDARETPQTTDSRPHEGTQKRDARKAATSLMDDDEGYGDDNMDETTNLNEPRSQSGKYWKAEFDEYRTKTIEETEQLIRYRSAARDFAKKKDDEAGRLTTKLKEEEKRLAEMERRVSELASNVVGDESKGDNKKLVKELTKQTALALQYKHRITLLRQVLEKHGVVDSEIDNAGAHELGTPIEKTAMELRRAQRALENANAKIDEQRAELSKLRALAQASDQKVTKLEEENMSLKQSLTRAKDDMGRTEGRHGEREANLRQRESKLEARVKEYREQLRKESREHRERERDLKAALEKERARNGHRTAESPKSRPKEAEKLHKRSPHKPTSTDAEPIGIAIEREPDEPQLHSPSLPSMRPKRRALHHSRAGTTRPSPRPTKTIDTQDIDMPSSPDDILVQYAKSVKDPEETTRLNTPSLSKRRAQSRTQKHSRTPRHNQRRRQSDASLLLSNLPTPEEEPDRKHLSSPVQYSLDAITGTKSRTKDKTESKSDEKRVPSVSAAQRTAMGPERVAAAQARLKEKAQRKASDGKENALVG